MKSLLLIGALSLIVLPLSAQSLYKWTDKNGEVHYSSTAPDNQKTSVESLNLPSSTKKKIDEEAAKDATKEDAQTDGTEKTGAALQEKYANEAKQLAAKDEEKRKQSCDAVRKNLAIYQNYPKARVKVGDVVRRLTQEELTQRIAESEAQIKEYCDD